MGADSDEIIFTSGATESNNAALLGLGRRASGNRRRILLSTVEHKCVLAVGRVVSRVPWKSSGVASAELGYLSRLRVVKPERRGVIAFREAA